MKKRTAQKTLQYMIALFLEYLEELNVADCTGDDFIYGEKTAYVECLELIQFWNSANKNGLNFNIEERFQL